MIEELERVVEDISTVHSKLVLLIGEPGAGKSVRLRQLAERRADLVLHVGAALGRELLHCRRSTQTDGGGLWGARRDAPHDQHGSSIPSRLGRYRQVGQREGDH